MLYGSQQAPLFSSPLNDCVTIYQCTHLQGLMLLFSHKAIINIGCTSWCESMLSFLGGLYK